MSNHEARGDHISGTVTGDVPGQVAIGKEIHQAHVVGEGRPDISDAEREDLRRAFAELRAQVAATAPAESKDSALERVDELEEAVTADEPDISTMEYVKRWFARKLPGIVGTVTGVLVHPVVGKLVHAAGEAAVSEFNRRVEQA